MAPQAPDSAPQRFRDLLEVAPDAMVIADRSGRILLANGQAERLLGYARDELVGEPVEILLPERFRGRHVDHRAAYLNDPRPRPMGAALALFARRKDGSEFPTEISLSPLEDRDGPVVIAAIRDISERRLMQEALRLSEERLRLLVESVKEYAIFMLDSEGNIQTWGAGAERINGYTAPEIVGRHYSVLFPPEDAAAGKPRRELSAAVRESQYREEGWRVRKGGTRFLADLTVTPLWNADGSLRGFAKVVQDVTERRRAEEEKQRAVRARDELLSIVSHDLQNAVNALALNTQVLLRIRPESEREARMHQYGEIVDRSADTMKRLIRDLLDTQQIERGQLSITRRPEEVVPLVREALDPLQAVAVEKSVRLETRFDAASGSAVCDRERILQVLHNLVGNAIKFVPDGGRVVVETAPSDSQVRFTVGDDGPGILPEDLPHVFDRHWQAQSNVLRRGSGLGLFIVKTVVEAHGGRTWVESTPGAGASFSFTLPAA
jgi:PAS domain S-box-containing protein